jgi:hypothetical protein
MRMPMVKPRDPLEFDPSLDMTRVEPEPKPGRPEESSPDRSRTDRASDDGVRDVPGQAAPGEAGALSSSEAMAPAAPPRKKPKPLQLDFTDVLGPGGKDMTGVQRIGAASLNTEEFMDREAKRAMERALQAPQGDLPSSLEREVYQSGVQVVAETRRYGWMLVLLVVVPALLAILGAVGVWKWRAHRTAQQIEEMRRMQDLDREMALQREKDLARATR